MDKFTCEGRNRDKKECPYTFLHFGEYSCAYCPAGWIIAAVKEGKRLDKCQKREYNNKK